MPALPRRLRPFLALLLYALFAAWLTWPALDNLGAAIPGNDGDAFVHLWTFDWVKDALLSGQSPFHTARLFHPDGVALYTHNIAWLNIALWLPVQAFTGGAAAYTLTYLLVLVLNGTAVFFLVRHLSGHDAAALVAGFITTGWPYIIGRPSQPNLIFIACLPLALLFLHRLSANGRWLDALWLALAVAGLGLSRFQLLIMSAPLLAAAALFWLWGVPAGGRGRVLAQMLAAAALAALLLAPVAGPVLWFQATREHAADILPDEEPWGEADLLGFLLPGGGAPGGEQVAARLPNLLTRTPIGWITLLLAALGLLAPRRDKWLWLGLGLLTLLLALGRVLTFNGQELMALPYAWLEEHLGVVALIRYPSRYTALLVVPTAVLAGYGVTWLAARLPRRAIALAVPLLLLLIAAEDRVAAYPLLPLETPAWYVTLAAEPGTSGLVSVPFSRGFDEYAMTYQLTHGQPLVSGHVSRPPREAFAFIEATPFLSALRERVTTPPPEVGEISAQLQPLAAADLPLIAIHKRFLTPAESSAWRLWFGIPPIHEDDELLVYPTGLSAGEGFAAQPSGLPGIAFVGGQISPATLVPGATAVAVVHWALDAGVPAEWQACITLHDDAGDVAASCAPLRLPVPSNGNGLLARSEQPLTLDPPPADGRYTATLTLGRDAVQSVPLPLGPLYVASAERQFAAPPLETETAVSFGPRLTLLGFDGPRLANQSLDLTLFWHAAQEMDISYKIFLHVLDAESGALVAQLDTVPRDWSYPTNVWHAGEVVSDRLSLALGDLPPGRYDLRLGAYHPDTGARLPLSAADPAADLQDDSLRLAQITIPD